MMGRLKERFAAEKGDNLREGTKPKEETGKGKLATGCPYNELVNGAKL